MSVLVTESSVHGWSIEHLDENYSRTGAENGCSIPRTAVSNEGDASSPTSQSLADAQAPPFQRPSSASFCFSLGLGESPAEQFFAPRCLSLHASALAFRRTLGSITLSRTSHRDLFAREVHFCPRRASLSFPHASQLRQGDRRGEQCS